MHHRRHGHRQRRGDAQHLISKYDANAIIFSGIAGGLNPALHIDDVVIGERLRYIDTDTALIAESAPGWRSSRAATSSSTSPRRPSSLTAT